MSRRDIVIVVLLFALWMAWPYLDRHVIKPLFFPSPPIAERPVEAGAEGEQAPADTVGAGKDMALIEQPELIPPAQEQVPEPRSDPLLPEQILALENDAVRLEISTRGAVVLSATLKKYPATRDEDSGPVVLDFRAAPALSPFGPLASKSLPDFELIKAEETRVELRRRERDGVVWMRALSLTNGYMLTVEDRFVNEDDRQGQVPLRELWTGPMLNLDGQTERGVVYLGADTLSPGGEGVKYWGRGFAKWFREARKKKTLPKLPVFVVRSLERPVDWVAAKNKYFAQILIPEMGGEDGLIYVTRQISEAERQNPSVGPRDASPYSVAVGARLMELNLAPGESHSWVTRLYIGPKKYSELSRYRLHLVDVMEFGMWAPVGKLLLRILIAIHDYLWPHNYGVAIMLLTIIIRAVFWPITHKSTESMKKMQAIQPLITEVREKYKNNPQRMQQEMMALYKEHKVNPLAGCLPMLIQIPVFIALYVVLRSAIELRFSPFLWIRDLSQPENLFADQLPIPLNILPILMAVTMAWQQKLTPSGGDRNQQKMMMFMPVMFLFMFYNIASGLVLYWTTNQCLMIIQQLWMHRAFGGAAAASAHSARPR